jgi:hypothetical protein
MNFASALFALKRGRKIKRHHWTGYWCLGSKDSKKPYVEMHCYDGKIVNLADSEDILYTMENMACDDWEIIDERIEKKDNA